MPSAPLMRWIDRHVGEVLVHLIPIRKPGAVPRVENPREIVVSKYFGLGSLLMATPLLRELRTRFPGARIRVLTFKQNETLVRLFPFVDGVIAVDGRSIPHLLRSTLAAIDLLRRVRVDLLVDLEFFARYSALVAYLSGAAARVGFSAPGNDRTRLLTHSIEIPYPMPIRRAFLSQLVAAGLATADEIERTDFSIYGLRPHVRQESMDRARALLAGLGSRDFLLMNPVGGEAIGKEREWPAEHWTALANRVVKELGLGVVFTGDKSRMEEVRSLAEGCKNAKVHSLAGMTTFDEFVALICLARAVVTIDSAALHIAQSVGTPTVSLHGPELPLVHAYSEEWNRALHAGYHGAPCPCFCFHENKEVRCLYKNECMRAIQPGAVLEALQQVTVPVKNNPLQ